jgi:hypothetical protein
MSTFTHAGTSRLNGSVKVRFANDALRVKVLEKNGHTEVDLIELPQPMLKKDAVAYLKEIEFWKANNGIVNSAVQNAIEDAQDGRAAKAAKTARSKKTETVKPIMEGIKVKVEAKKAAVESSLSKAEIITQLKNMEDAPF